MLRGDRSRQLHSNLLQLGLRSPRCDLSLWLQERKQCERKQSLWLDRVVSVTSLTHHRSRTHTAPLCQMIIQRSQWTQIDHVNDIAAIRYIVPPPTTSLNAHLGVSSRVRPPHRGRVQFQLPPDGQMPTFTSARHSTSPVAASGIAARAIVSTPSAVVNDTSRPGTVMHIAALDSPGIIGSSDAHANQLQTPISRLQPAVLTSVDNALQPNPLQLVNRPQSQSLQQWQQQPTAPRPPSPFMAQLDAYYKRLAAQSAREARSVPSDVWTELALQDTAVHDWPNNLSHRWRKFVQLHLESVHTGVYTRPHLI